MNALLVATVAAYMVISAALCAFAANLLLYSLRTWRSRPSEAAGTITDLGRIPRVTVQLPIFNELYVAERVIDAACALEWPRDRFQVQVLDDSTDETTAIVAAAVRRWQAQGIDIEHLHRTDREGYKAGALRDGLAAATGEFIAIFDADFVPTSDFLLRTLPEFTDDRLAFVQARWGHLNRHHSFMTRLQAIAIDAHFLIDQANRGRAGYWFNFNGTAGVWRRAAIDDAGGWRADTLTEDLDLSYRAHLAGWHATYLEDLVVPAELPVDITGFRRQQHRWARGSLECAIRLLPSVWKSGTSPSTRWQATIHLTSYTTHLLLFLLVLLYPPLTLAETRFMGSTNLFGFGWVLAIMSVTPTVFFLTGQLHRRNRSWREVPWVFFVSMFGSGLMLNTTRAFLQILTRPRPAFERTAKFGIDAAAVGDGTAAWTGKRYQLDVDRIVWAEFALGAYSSWGAWLAARNGNWGIFTFAVIFAVGLFGVGAASVAHGVAVRRARHRRSETIRAERRALDPVAGQTGRVRRAIVVMAKRPTAGHTKTRLTPELTAQQAADLYEHFLRDIVDALAARTDASLFIAVDTPESAEWFERFAPGIPQLPQLGDDLGERLDSVMTACLDEGYDQVFAISSDSPDLPAAHLTTAFAQLDDPTVDVVLGPTEDGGYYVIGWKQRWQRLVTDVTMSTPQVLADSLAVADELEARVALAPSWYDIDVPADLARLRASLDALDDPAPRRTADYLATL